MNNNLNTVNLPRTALTLKSNTYRLYYLICADAQRSGHRHCSHLSKKKLAEKMGLPVASISRCLTTLKSKGFIGVTEDIDNLHQVHTNISILDWQPTENPLTLEVLSWTN